MTDLHFLQQISVLVDSALSYLDIQENDSVRANESFNEWDVCVCDCDYYAGIESIRNLKKMLEIEMKGIENANNI